MFFGIVLIFSPLTNLLHSIPYIGGITGTIADYIVYIFAFLFTIIFGTLTIAFAYILYRPVYAISIILCITMFLVLSYANNSNQIKQGLLND